ASRSVTPQGGGLVAEVAASGEHHRRASRPNGLGDLVVALRAAGLDDPRHSGVECGLRAVGKGKERIGGEHGSLDVVTVLAGLVERDSHRVDAARLAPADADGRQVLDEDDRVRADVLADAPGEDEIAPAGLVGLAAGDLHRLSIVDVPVTVLDEDASEDAFEVTLTA